MSAALILTCRVVAFTKVEVRNALFTNTSVPEVNPVPVIVKVKLGPPDVVEGGDKLTMLNGVVTVL